MSKHDNLIAIPEPDSDVTNHEPTVGSVNDFGLSDMSKDGSRVGDSALESINGNVSVGGPDPKDLDTLWVPYSPVETTTELAGLHVGPRPPKDKFISVNPFRHGGAILDDYENCRPVHLFEYQFTGDMASKTWYVRPGTDVYEQLREAERLKPAVLVQGIVHNGDPFIWELKLPAGRNESSDKWARSRLEVATRATREWVKPKANMSAGGYDVTIPKANYDLPDWKSVDFDEAVKLACKDKVIVDDSHEAVREALGL